MPTGEMAMEEERTESHGGLFFEDVLIVDKTMRLFLPN
jgi:hypothetical protein